MKIRLVFLLLLFLYGFANITNIKVLKLAHGLDSSYPVHKGMLFMEESMAKKSKGTLLMEIYPSQQLGTGRQALEMLQIEFLVSNTYLKNR